MSNSGYEVKKRFTDLFNNVAQDFDEQEPRYFSYFGECMVRLAGIKKGDSVLDVAAGRGASLFPASETVGEKGLVIGTDISKNMIDLMSAEIEKRGITNTRVLEMDAESLSFPDENFDCILCGFGVFFFPDYKSALQEFKRVLKKDGLCCVTTFLRKDYEESNWIKDLMQKYLESQNQKKASVEQLSPPEFDTQEGLYKIFEAEGFNEIKVFSEEKEFIFKDENEWWKKQWTQATRINLEKLSAEKLEQFKQDAFSQLQRRREPDGIHFKVPVLFALVRK
ncbi:MAG: class I SAM-dependent methyltransferase [Bacillota bacterium]|nr:class I SAM-dependent methyltransferase [Bacillota bacterium]